jgi:uncharacterized protein YndB with AHSA1/START domain
MAWPYQLDRFVTIAAPREVVFSFFTDSARWATWWGAGSTIDAKVGGRVSITLPGNTDVSGEVLELHAPQHLVFSYGYASGKPFPPGASRVTIRLEDAGSATRLHLTHEFPDEASGNEHVQGWRYQLSLFSNAVLDVVHAHAADKVDAWFALWAEPDAAVRGMVLAGIASPAVSFRDRYSMIDGVGDLSAHIAAGQRFMPGVVLQRRGNVRHCQGMVIVDWAITGKDGATMGTGSNVFVMGADGRIAGVTGFWG